MAFPKFHGIHLALNSWIENGYFERLATDPATLDYAGRFWYNTTDKVFKFTSLDASNNVVVQTIQDVASANSALSTLQQEVDKIEAGAGLNTDGTYIVPTASNYINASTSLANALSLLDAQIKTNAVNLASEITNRETAVSNEATARSTADSNIQSELDKAEAGAGLNADGSYAAPTTSNYINSSTSLANADMLLDAQLKSVADEAAANAADKVSKSGDTMTGNLVMQSGAHVTINDAPVNPTDAANMKFVQDQIAGLSWKNEVLAASTGAIGNLSGDHQASANYTLDGVVIPNGARVLVKDGASADGVAAASAANNGIYSAAVTNVAGVVEVAELTINSAPTSPNVAIVIVDGSNHGVQLDPATDTTADAVAAKFGALSIPGWTLSVSGAVVTFTANAPGAHQDISYNDEGTGATGTVNTSTQGADASSTAVFTRTSDTSTIAELASSAVFVQRGTVNADIGFTCTTDSTAVLGTDPVNFVQFNGAANIVAGTGLSKTGNQIDVNLGAGIAQLPTDEVGVDVRSDSGLFLTEDGATSSTGTNAQLSVLLDGTTLSRSTSGLRVSADTMNTIASKASQTEVDAIEAGAGLNADGTYTADATSNYIKTATSLANADHLLDAQVKTNADNIATLTANAGNGAKSLQNSLNAQRFTYLAGAAATSYTIAHNLNSDFLSFTVMVQGDDGLYHNDIVPVTETDKNNVQIDLTESRLIKVAIIALDQLA